MRESWDKYFMRIAFLVSERTTCFSEGKGALIVKNRNIISTGYNGAPAGIKNCKYDLGYCPRHEAGAKSGEDLHLCKAAHAEANAIVQAAKHGNATLGSTLYCTHLPCNECAKLIINAGIKEVIYSKLYNGTYSPDTFKEAGVKLTQVV